MKFQSQRQHSYHREPYILSEVDRADRCAWKTIADFTASVQVLLSDRGHG